MGSNLEKVEYIKRVQREYFRLFDEKLAVDFNKTFGIHPRWVLFDEQECLNKINELCSKYGTTLEIFKGLTRVSTELRPIMIEYVKYCMENNYNLAKCGKLINRDRTTISHYKKRL